LIARVDDSIDRWDVYLGLIEGLEEAAVGAHASFHSNDGKSNQRTSGQVTVTARPLQRIAHFDDDPRGHATT
jgi:hypothetical protein